MGRLCSINPAFYPQSAVFLMNAGFSATNTLPVLGQASWYHYHWVKDYPSTRTKNP